MVQVTSSNSASPFGGLPKLQQKEKGTSQVEEHHGLSGIVPRPQPGDLERPPVISGLGGPHPGAELGP